MSRNYPGAYLFTFPLLCDKMGILVKSRNELILLNFDSTRVKIDLDAIEANFDAIRRKAAVPVMAIIKADAYGHGAGANSREEGGL